MTTTTTPSNDSKQKCLIHILAKALLDLLECNHGQIVHYNNRDFVVRKNGQGDLIIVEEASPDTLALKSNICEEFIKIM